MPRLTLAPMLATSATALPEGPLWTYEVKWDGYRALAVKDGNRVQLLSRNQKDLTHDYPSVVAAIKTLRSHSVVLDGEIVAVDAQGRPSFQALQHRTAGGLAIVYYAFDVLRIGTESLVRQSLDARRERLRLTVLGSGVLLSDSLPGSPARIERAIRKLGLEGVIAKRRDSLYESGERTAAWVKVKFNQQQEFVIGGYKPDGQTFDSVLVGYYDGRDLLFAAKLRNGFTGHVKQDLFAAIARQAARTCPFVNLPNSIGRGRWGEGITAEDMASLRWVRPRIVVQVAFVEWTRGNLLRHPSFLGVRPDKPAGDVRRERTRDD